MENRKRIDVVLWGMLSQFFFSFQSQINIADFGSSHEKSVIENVQTYQYIFL